MQSNRKSKGPTNTNYSNLHLSAQVKDALTSYNKKGAWKSKTSKMGRTLTGQTLGKTNAMTEDDIDRLFQGTNQPSQEKLGCKLTTEIAENFDMRKDYVSAVKFLQVDD